MKIGSYLLAGLASAVMLVPVSRAQTFDQTQDVSLFLGFRNIGANDYVVNIGTISSFLSQGAGTTTVLGYSASDLNTAMGGFNSLTLSIFGTGPAAANTLTMSRARTDINTQTTPWTRNLSTLQGNTSSKVRTIGNEAESYGTSIPAGPNNTATAIVEPDADFAGPRVSYSENIGASGNFGGSFSGNIEGTTGAAFSSGGTPLRLDLYNIVASTSGGASAFVGFFDFNTDGTMTFTVVPEAGTMAAGVAMLMLFAATQRRRLQRAMGLTK